MEVIHVFDSETQKSINELKEYIASIYKEYELKLHPKTATACMELSMPKYKEAIIKEYKEAIRPYQKLLEEIYLKSVPKIIIKIDK